MERLAKLVLVIVGCMSLTQVSTCEGYEGRKMAAVLARAGSWTADRSHYGVINLAIFVLWIVSQLVLSAVHHPVGMINSLFIPAVVWNIASYRRIADTKLWFVHLAPYATWLGCRTLFWGFVLQQGIPAGDPPPTDWQIALEYLALPLDPAWLVAAVVLGLKEARA